MSRGEELSAKEVAMAKTLVESLSGEWEPDKYVDHYQEALREVIEAKIQHRPKGEAPKAPKSTGPVIDLLKACAESIKENAGKRRQKPAATRGSRSTAGLVKQKRKTGVLGTN